MSISLVTNCGFPVPPIRVQPRKVLRSNAGLRHGINFNTKYFLELFISPLELLVVPDLHLVVDVVIVVIVDALDRLAEVRGPDPGALQHAVGMGLHGPIINYVLDVARVEVLASGDSYLLEASEFTGPTCDFERNEQRSSRRPMYTRPSAALALLAPTVHMPFLGYLVTDRPRHRAIVEM